MKTELAGRIDSTNAARVEAELLAKLTPEEPVELDAAKLEYISSAGLRILLHLRKTNPEMRVFNVSSEVYEILEMTGFTEFIRVEKAFREISVEGCEEIGHGANGSVYRYDNETAVKVYRSQNDLEAIRHEREMAKLALVLGIPTAISYDVVRVGEHYGTVFELLNARSFSSIIAGQPEKLDWCVAEFAGLLKQMHDIEVPAGRLPDMRQTALDWVRFLQGELPQPAWEKLLALTEGVPPSARMIHGDYHTKNLVVQNGEVLLIDMDTLAQGNRIFELGSIYNSFLGFYELDREGITRFQGFSYETARRFWRSFLAAYLETEDEDKCREVEDKARIIGYVRLIRRGIRRGARETAEGRREIEHWRQELMELLDKTDTLVFSRKGLTVPARTDRLTEVQAYVAGRLEERCSMKTQMQIDVAVEEIFVNIASYAYAPGEGTACVEAEISGDSAVITFTDRGTPYNPLEKEDPDVTAMAQERKIGGLGIFLTKQVMDEVRYERRDGQNILTLRKKL